MDDELILELQVVRIEDSYDYRILIFDGNKEHIACVGEFEAEGKNKYELLEKGLEWIKTEYLPQRKAC